MSKTQKITYELPPILETGRAAEYCGVGASRIRHAVRDGDLRPVGRRGGGGPLTFERIDLDRWMRGGHPVGKECSISDCPARVDVAGLCTRHASAKHLEHFEGPALTTNAHLSPAMAGYEFHVPEVFGEDPGDGEILSSFRKSLLCALFQLDPASTVLIRHGDDVQLEEYGAVVATISPNTWGALTKGDGAIDRIASWVDYAKGRRW